MQDTAIPRDQVETPLNWSEYHRGVTQTRPEPFLQAREEGTYTFLLCLLYKRANDPVCPHR
jgi:hypothetical protein